MALITCKNCGKMISDKAKACPHCGTLVDFEQTVNDESSLNHNQETEPNRVVTYEPVEYYEESERKSHAGLIITAVLGLLRSPGQILVQCFLSALSFLALTGSIVFVYHAFGLSGTSWDKLLTLSLLLFVSASYTPLPGASGAQEGGFMYYFNTVFPGGTKGLALLIWRFFTYYLFLFVGVVMVLLERIIPRRRPKETEDPSPDPPSDHENPHS